MKSRSILLTVCLAFIATASGTPTTSPQASTTGTSSSSKKSTSTAKTATPSATSVATNYDINFDERTVIPLLPALNPVGIEKTIFFNSWVLNDPGTNVTVIPHTLPNDIATAVEQQAVNGTPSLTTLYSGSKIKSFDLHSFWFGCLLQSVEGEADVAVQCTITVAGFRNGQQVAVASFTFSPIVGELAVPMIEAVLEPDFVTLQNVTIVQGDPILQALVADDFNVTTHT